MASFGGPGAAALYNSLLGASIRAHQNAAAQIQQQQQGALRMNLQQQQAAQQMTGRHIDMVNKQEQVDFEQALADAESKGYMAGMQGGPNAQAQLTGNPRLDERYTLGAQRGMQDKMKQDAAFARQAAMDEFNIKAKTADITGWWDYPDRKVETEKRRHNIANENRPVGNNYFGSGRYQMDMYDNYRDQAKLIDSWYSGEIKKVRDSIKESSKASLLKGGTPGKFHQDAIDFAQTRIDELMAQRNQELRRLQQQFGQRGVTFADPIDPPSAVPNPGGDATSTTDTGGGDVFGEEAPPGPPLQPIPPSAPESSMFDWLPGYGAVKGVLDYVTSEDSGPTLDDVMRRKK